jgi:hypothetical protein
VRGKDGLDRILRVDINDLRALASRHGEAIVFIIDSDDPAGAPGR